MDAGIFGEFGVEGGGHGFALADSDGGVVGAFGGEDFDAGANVDNFGGANENHFDGRVFDRPVTDRAVAEGGVVRIAGVVIGGVVGVEEPALADGAVDLASVSVAADADVEGAEASLRGIFDFGGEQDGAGAGSEGGLGVDEFFQLGEACFAKEFEESAGFAAGDDEPIDEVELLGLFYQHDFSAEFFETAAVGVEIALQGQDSDFHDGMILTDDGARLNRGKQKWLRRCEPSSCEGWGTRHKAIQMPKEKLKREIEKN